MLALVGTFGFCALLGPPTAKSETPTKSMSCIGLIANRRIAPSLDNKSNKEYKKQAPSAKETTTLGCK
jgi:hypothetical protein